MKKTIVIMALALVQSVAFATIVERPLLKVTKTNGSVAAQHRTDKVCTLNSSMVTVRETKNGEITKTDFSRVMWSSEIPNANALRSLIVKASKGELVRLMPRLGGSISHYEAFININQMNRTTVNLGLVNGHILNTSRAAEKLRNFADTNCLSL